jgi:hypothetical protein
MSNVRQGAGRARLAARAFGLMETDNINSDQLSNTKVGNGELAISVVQR